MSDNKRRISNIEAIRALVRARWGRNYGTQGGEPCLAWTVEMALGLRSDASESILRGLAALIYGSPQDSPRCMIGVWNDAPERTKEDVLALLDKYEKASAP